MTTTNIKIEKSLLVTRDDNIFRLVPESSCVPLNSLSSISLLKVAPPGGVQTSKIECIKTCIKLLRDKLKNYSIWLLPSTASWQPNSAIVNHLKLWKSLKRSGYNLSLEAAQEISVKSHEGIKFFGATKLQESELEAGLSILTKKRMSLLILLPDEHKVDLQKYVDKRWEFAREHDYDFWTAVITYTCCNGGIFLRSFGEFDDREAGVSAVMQRDLFENNFL